MIILNSKIARVLLPYFFLHPDSKLYINEMVNKFNLDKRNLIKKLKEFEDEGLLVSEKIGAQKYYSLNKKFPLYNEYKKIILKTIGVENQLSEILRNIKGVKEAYIFGSYAADDMDSTSDIDLLIVGKVNTIELHKRLAALQKKIEREINLINMSEQEFAEKRKKDFFIKNIFRKKTIKLV